MTHDLPEGVVRFTNENDEVAYKMPHTIEQYNSLSNLEKEHTKSVYLRNEEDKRRGVDYVMSKILGFYKECLELGPEYVTGLDDDGEVTYFAFGRHLEELHVTWAHLEKKRTRLRTYTNISQDYVLSSWRRRHSFYVTPSQCIPRRRHIFHDDVRDHDPAHYLEYSLS
ncbi:hypothetical protein Tco_1204127 [Tanacetum coccineum]